MEGRLLVERGTEGAWWLNRGCPRWGRSGSGVSPLPREAILKYEEKMVASPALLGPT